MTISIRFQPTGPLNSEGLAYPGDSALIMTTTKAEAAFAQRIVDALSPLYVEGADSGLFAELEVDSA